MPKQHTLNSDRVRPVRSKAPRSPHSPYSPSLGPTRITRRDRHRAAVSANARCRPSRVSAPWDAERSDLR